MNNFLSALLGLSFIVCFFLISFFSVVIIKIVILYFKPSKPEVKPVKKTPPKKVKPALKSIEINTDDIDKIYFKKSS